MNKLLLITYRWYFVLRSLHAHADDTQRKELHAKSNRHKAIVPAMSYPTAIRLSADTVMVHSTVPAMGVLVAP